MSNWSTRRFANRREAGLELAPMLRKYGGRNDVVVLALPRGGVPVAFEIAEALDAPLDIFIVRKLGMPGHPGTPLVRSPLAVFVSSATTLCGRTAFLTRRSRRSHVKSRRNWSDASGSTEKDVRSPTCVDALSFWSMTVWPLDPR